MYETFFHLRSRPFVSAPQTTTYFPAAAIENARQTLTRLITRGEGPGLIIGPPGTGKSLLCQLLAEQFQDQFAVVVLSCCRLKATQAMLQAVLYELGLPCRGVDEGDMRLSLMDYLEPKAGGPAGLLLIVDEAHTLSWRLLDEFRMLTNLVRDGQPRVRVVLAGGAVLEERFASPKMESFSQRLAGRCYLEPLDSVETAAYVRAQLAAANGDAALIDDEALRSVYRASDGIPRLINQVCDHALILASAGGHRQLTSDAIDEAWADLQQLPPPWTPGEADDASSQVVEFGELDDDPSRVPEAIPFRPNREQSPSRPLSPGTPDQQLEAIENQLAAIECDESSESGTEQDLDFPEFGDPFTERFAEEEVVVESYTSDVEIFADVPRVSSWEGQRLGSLLEEVETGSWPPGTPAADVRISGACADETVDWDPTTECTASVFSPELDPVFPEESAADGQPEQAACEPTAAQDKPATTANPLPLDKLTGAENDRDVIVVEDDPPGTTLGVSQPQARKGEFRQLFAKLRRG